MSSRKLLTIFGATGNQGGSILDVFFDRPELQQKYSLRGITRDPTSAKSKALSDKGVEMVKAELDDAESIKAAVKGSYGVFGVTDFWAIMNKDIEIQQGKNIFEACKAEDVKHIVFSALPSATKLTKGVLRNVDHFDSKATVMEHIEASKGAMIASFFMPAMFIEGTTASVRVMDGSPTLALPFPSENIAWPLLAPRRDVGKYVMGLFEGEKSADGAKVHGGSWTTPKEVVANLSKKCGQEVVFKPIPAEAFQSILIKARGEQAGKELAEMMVLIGEYNYYGKGEEKKQAESDKWLINGSNVIDYASWASEKAPSKYE